MQFNFSRSPLVLLILFIFASAHAQTSKVDLSNLVTEVQAGGVVTVSAPISVHPANSSITVSLTASDTTGQGVTGFDTRINFNPAVVTFQGCSTTGTIFASAVATCNLFPTPDVIAITMNGITPVSGAGPIVKLNFLVTGAAGSSSPLNFQFFTFGEGDPASVTNNGSLTVAAPTAANTTVQGVVRNASGRAIPRALVTILDGDGFTRSAVTNSFGYFNLLDIPAGRTYLVNTSAKGLTFSTTQLNLVDSVKGIEIIAEP